MYVLGIDIGTQGVRGLVVDKNGYVAAAHSTPFEVINTSEIESHKEQNPRIWWDATMETIKGIINILKEKKIDPDEILLIALDGTSGTIVPLIEMGSVNVPGSCVDGLKAYLMERRKAFEYL